MVLAKAGKRAVKQLYHGIQDPCVEASNKCEHDDWDCLSHLRAEKVISADAHIEDAHVHFFIASEGDCENCAVKETCPVCARYE